MTWNVERVAECGSTMDVAKQKARAGGADRWAVVAETMSKGRGTLDHAWHAPRGGLYTSFILRGPSNPHLLTLALGNAVADVLEVAGVEPRIKWVNDVFVADKKIAGILVEAESTGSQIDFLVCGIGINLNGHAKEFPSALRATATTLEDELACDVCIPDLEGFLWQAIDTWLDRLGHDPARVIAATRERDALNGKRVAVISGKQRTEGVASGLDDKGHLLVKTAKGTQAIASGSVDLL